MRVSLEVVRKVMGRCGMREGRGLLDVFDGCHHVRGCLRGRGCDVVWVDVAVVHH
jgi:hypothetical protein